MRFGMNLLLWTAKVTSEHFPLLARLKQTGFDGVEFLANEGDRAHYQMLGKELNNQGLASTTVTIMTAETNPVSPDAAIRRAALDRLKQAIENTAAAGGTVLCGPIHSALGVFTGTGPTEDERKWAADVLRQAAEEGKKANVMLAVEYLNRFECYFLTTAADTHAFVQRVNHPNLRMMYDTFHANIEEKDVEQAIAAAADRIVHIHVSENDRGTPGTGHVHWDETFRALKKASYDGWLTIEAFGRLLPALAAATRIWRDLFPGPEEVYTQGLRFMKEKWAAAGR